MSTHNASRVAGEEASLLEVWEEFLEEGLSAEEVAQRACGVEGRLSWWFAGREVVVRGEVRSDLSTWRVGVVGEDGSLVEAGREVAPLLAAILLSEEVLVEKAVAQMRSWGMGQRAVDLLSTPLYRIVRRDSRAEALVRSVLEERDADEARERARRARRGLALEVWSQRSGVGRMEGEELVVVEEVEEDVAQEVLHWVLGGQVRVEERMLEESLGLLAGSVAEMREKVGERFVEVSEEKLQELSLLLSDPVGWVEAGEGFDEKRRRAARMPTLLLTRASETGEHAVYAALRQSQSEGGVESTLAQLGQWYRSGLATSDPAGRARQAYESSQQLWGGERVFGRVS